jgi:hypothetical protein
MVGCADDAKHFSISDRRPSALPLPSGEGGGEGWFTEGEGPRFTGVSAGSSIMKRLLDMLVRVLDRCLHCHESFAPYIVTPRQGKHVVRRRLLRSLTLRMATPTLGLLT